MNMIRALFAVAIIAIAAPASAQVYIFGAGSHIKADTRTVPETSGNDTTSFHVGAGWRFSPYFAAEIGYLGLGHYGSADGLTQWTAEGFGIAAVGTLPLSGPWALVGKVGAYQLDSELGRCCSTITKQDLGTRPLLAIGGQYHVGDALYVQALYQQVNGKDGTELDKLRLFSIGALLQF